MRSIDIHSAGVLRVTKNELTARNLRSFYESASALAQSGVRELVIDLSEVGYIDSASLGCLMDICRIMSGQRGEVKLIGLQERVRALAVMAGLTRVIGVSGDDGIRLKNLAPFTVIREKGIQR